MSDAKRKSKISKLRALADHPNTPPHEAEAARNRIRALEGSKVSEPTPKATAEELKRLADDISRASRAQQTTRHAFVDFDAAIKSDPRTPAQRNADMQNRIKYQGGTRPKGCSNPENYYDSGGIARKRNTYTTRCEACGCELRPGEGAIMQVGNEWKAWCCERVPGPRRKKRS